jgi:hypothetical protein
MDLSTLSKSPLLEKCNELGFHKYKSKNKAFLIEFLTQHTNTNTSHNLIECVNNLLSTISMKELAKKLNISLGTIIRWLEFNDIPKNYEFDILKISNIPVDYSIYSSKEKNLN